MQTKGEFWICNFIGIGRRRIQQSLFWIIRQLSSIFLAYIARFYPKWQIIQYSLGNANPRKKKKLIYVHHGFHSRTGPRRPQHRLRHSFADLWPLSQGPFYFTRLGIWVIHHRLTKFAWKKLEKVLHGQWTALAENITCTKHDICRLSWSFGL